MPSQKPSHKVVLISILDHVFQTPFYIKKKILEITQIIFELILHYFCQSVFSLKQHFVPRSHNETFGGQNGPMPSIANSTFAPTVSYEPISTYCDVQ